LAKDKGSAVSKAFKIRFKKALTDRKIKILEYHER
jgi:hypothetical protein